MDKSQKEAVKSIFTAIEKHPNAKVSKLIKSFELEKTPQNLALLLIELAEHPEFSADISISLKYYLNCFESLYQEPSFAESGIVLYNSSKIYAKRVDHVHQEIERLILSLSNVEETAANNVKNPDMNSVSQNPIKEKRGRKRTLEQMNGPYEANISPKRFKPLSETKRFDESLAMKRNNAFKKNAMSDMDKSTKSYIPQATWQYSFMQDFDYEDEVDSKKNYKLFIYHLEHRYNTLISDINLKMYFKVKDFIDGAAKGSSELPKSWPPLSDAYIKQYLNLEDTVMLREGHFGRSLNKMDNSKLKKFTDRLLNKGKNNNETCAGDSGIVIDGMKNTSSISIDQSLLHAAEKSEINLSARNLSSDSGIDLETTIPLDKSIPPPQESMPIETTINIPPETNMPSETSNSSVTILENIQLPCRYTDPTESVNTKTPESSNNKKEKENEKLVQQTTKADPTLLTNSKVDEDLSTLKLILPHVSDEAIYMSDLDEKNRKMLSPSVITQDIFGCVKDKSNIVIKVDETVEQLFKIRQPLTEFFSLPIFERPDIALRLNFLKIPLKLFNKRRRFKLGPEYDIRKKERLKNYVRRSTVVAAASKTKPRKFIRLGDELGASEHVSPPSSPSYEPDWLGFPEVEEIEESIPDKSRSLSRDSGISLNHTDDFASELLSSTLKTTEPMENFSTESLVIPVIDATTGEMPSELPQIVADKQEPSVESDVPTPPSPAPPPPPNNDTNQSNTKADEINEEARIRTKVHEWHSHLQPILACSRERHHFDIFAIGTEIMTQFDRKDISSSSDDVSFENVMEDKEESFISRYFLSMLLLANQGNILIDVQNKSTSQPSELNDIRLKLLSRQRNIVSLEDNIGLQSTTTTTNNAAQEQSTTIETTTTTNTSSVAIVRTFKSVPEVPKMDDRDSGINLSEELSMA